MFKRISTILFIAILSICCSSLLYSQEKQFQDYSRLLSPEKLYLQTDREVYCIGDTIWFKGYLQNASRLAEYDECNYLYVELISTKYEKKAFEGKDLDVERVRQRVKVKRTDGRFEGYLPIKEDLNTGIAVLRAYSYWMLNENPAYMFNKSIELRNPMKDDFVKALVAGKYDDNEHYLDIGVKNPFLKEWLKPKVKKETFLDAQFLPESGRYFTDAESVLGVKVINQDGMGMKVHGKILADGRAISSFVTNDVGMGFVRLTVPSGTTSLKAEVESEVENFLFDYNVPLPESFGVALSVKSGPEGITVKPMSRNVSLPDSTFVILHDKSEIYFKCPLSTVPDSLRFRRSLLTSGINNAAIVDNAGNVYAKRTFFVYPEESFSAELNVDNPDYGKREKVSASISFKDSGGKPVSGDFSLAITDDEYAPYSGDNHNILSYLFLGSELKGAIEKPQQYFDAARPLDERADDIDALMLTQAWTYYDLPKILTSKNDMPTYGKEYTQSISGYVSGLFRKAKTSTICFAAPAINLAMITELDSTAYFALNGLDFQDGTQFLVGAQGQKKFLQKAYAPILNPDYFAGEYSYPKLLANAGYSSAYGEYATQSYYSVDGEHMYTITPSRVVALRKNVSPYPNDSFKKGQYRGEEQLEPYWNYLLTDYIAETCRLVRRLDGKTLECHIKGMGSFMKYEDRWVPILLYVNGMRASQSDIDPLAVSDIDAFVYLEGMDVYKYDPMCGFSDGTPTVCVLIHTKLPSHNPANVVLEKPIGWQKPARFYEPKYNKKDTTFEPMRATLHWIPTLNLSGGSSKFEFYNSGSPASRTVIIEGLTDDGYPVFTKLKI